VPVIAGLHGDTGHYEEALNVINAGAIPNLPDDAIVEVPAVVSAMGVQPIQMPPLPDGIAALCNRQVAIQGLVVEAGVTGDREAALQAMALDPLVPDMNTARALLDELLTVHAPYLPQFES
jgi:alpha-galactosidase